MDEFKYKKISIDEIELKYDNSVKLKVKYRNSKFFKEVITLTIGFLGLAGICYIPQIWLKQLWVYRTYLVFMSFALVVIMSMNLENSKKILKNKNKLEYVILKPFNIVIFLLFIFSIVLLVVNLLYSVNVIKIPVIFNYVTNNYIRMLYR